jgi:RNA polymerase sigma-70 factor (ECF subfamily)
MLATARRILGSEEDSADAVQDAFAAAFRAIGSFEEAAALGTWLHRIVVNASLQRLRRRTRRPTVSLDELLPHFGEDGHHAQPVSRWPDRPLDALLRDETRAQIRACIDRLPIAYREILLLRDIEDLDTETTAGLLGVTPGVVKTRLHRARQALRRLLEPFFGEEPLPHP